MFTADATNAVEQCRKFASEEDSLFLEDDTGRAQLDSTGPMALPVHALVTGIPVAVRGVVQANGALLVSDVVFAGVPPPRQPAAPKARLLIVSDLAFGGAQSPLPRQLLLEYLQGLMGAEAEAHRVCRVIVAGGLVAGKAAASSKAQHLDTGFRSKKKDSQRTTPDVEAMQAADLWLSQLASCCHVDVMPGPTDPSNVSLPQQPLHRIMVPLSAQLDTFHTCPNPYDVDANGLRVMGTSGQAVADVLRFTALRCRLPDTLPPSTAATAAAAAAAEEAGVESAQPLSGAPDFEDKLELSPARRLAVLDNMVVWGHLAPTCPDSLPGFPFQDRDPLLMTDCQSGSGQPEGPNLLFAGMQPCFASGKVSVPGGEVSTVLVPSFAATGKAVLVMEDMSITTICFAAGGLLGEAEAAAEAADEADGDLDGDAPVTEEDKAAAMAGIQLVQAGQATAAAGDDGDDDDDNMGESEA